MNEKEFILYSIRLTRNYHLLPEDDSFVDIFLNLRLGRSDSLKRYFIDYIENLIQLDITDERFARAI